MLGFLNSVGRTPNVTLPWYLGFPYSLEGVTADYAADFTRNGYVLNAVEEPFGDALTLTRSTEQTFIDSNGIIQTAAINNPALDYRGLALFATRKNLHPYSEDLSQWTGSVSNDITLTSEVAPDGSTDSVYRFNRNATTASYRQRSGLTKDNSNSEEVAFSTYIAKDDARYFAMRITGSGYANRANLVFDFDTETITDESVSGSLTDVSAHWEDAGNGWYRVWIIATTIASNGLQLVISFSDDGGQVDWSDSSNSCGGYVWGAQIELGDVPTPYIPTSGAAVTHNVSNANLNDTMDQFIAAGQGTIVFEFIAPVVKSSTQYIFTLKSSTQNGNIFLEYYSNGTLFFGFRGDGEGYSGIGSSVLVAGQKYQAVIAYEDNNITGLLNDGTVLTNTSKTAPTELDGFYLGTSDGSNFASNLYVDNMAYYNTRLSDSVLTSLKEFVLGGDSYMAGANGIGIKASLIADGYDVWNTAVGGLTLEAAVALIEALLPRKTVIFCDGSVNSHGTVVQDIAKYQRAYDAAGGNIVFISPVLYSGLSGTTDGQHTLDLTAAMLLENWNVVDGTAIARTLSGVSFTDPQDANDAGYANAAYDALFQADNVHPEQALADALTDAALLLI